MTGLVLLIPTSTVTGLVLLISTSTMTGLVLLTLVPNKVIYRGYISKSSKIKKSLHIFLKLGKSLFLALSNIIMKLYFIANPSFFTLQTPSWDPFNGRLFLRMK